MTPRSVIHIAATVCGAKYSTLRKDVARLSRSFAAFGETHWYVVESNSPSPETLMALERISQNVDRFRYQSLGQDSAGYRTERIARSRNACLDLVSAAVEGAELGHHILVVADLDGINKKVRLSPAVLARVVRDRVAVFPIQLGPYYDISALRHPVWNPSNPWQEFGLLRGLVGEENALNLAIRSKQIDLRGVVSPISVQSAFGGLGLYPLAEILQSSARYFGLESDGVELCEHVPFNLSLWKSGMPIQIDPTFVNASYTEHTRYSHPVIGPFLRLRHFLASLLPKAIRQHLQSLLADR